MSSSTTTRPTARRGRDDKRGFWAMRDLPVVGWLLAVVVLTAVHPFVPAPRWLMIHLLLLGAAGHAILVWSRFFGDTLLQTEPTPRAEQSRRLVLFDLGVLAIAVGVPTTWWPLTVAGATAVGLAVLWHTALLARDVRAHRDMRFAPTVHWYVAGGVLLPVGATLGAWLARDLADPLDTRVRVAHIAVNLLGWVGLAILGTLTHLWPTMLRTRIDERAERDQLRALPAVLGGIALIAVAALADLRLLVPAGLGTYAVGVALFGASFLRTGLRKRPFTYATSAVAAGLAWLLGLLLLVTVQTARAGSWPEVKAALEAVTPFLAAGFVAQVLLGALSHLVPVVLGGGPRMARQTHGAMDAGGPLRISATNLGLLVCLLPVPSVVRVLASVVVVVALAAFVPVLLRGIRLHRRLEAMPADERPEVEPRPAGQSTGLAVVGLAAVLLSVAVGGALDPAALGGLGDGTSGGVAATGRTTTVEVTMADMRYSRPRIEVPAGDRLVITLRNTDPSTVHDLVLETGQQSGRLAPGESTTMDVGVVGRDIPGWCSVVGHRQMGMVLTIVALGAPESAAPQAGPSAAPSPTAGHGTHQQQVGGTPGPGFTPRDAALPPVPSGRVHRHTFTVSETPVEVAPGVTQRLWTFNGTAPGPILRGKVGDTFEITLVNDGTIGHSIDFHAGALAPDVPMRTIPPGESLVYRFTAQRGGIWMYHCSTMPMTAHIANGMYGAVVIDPPGLPAVDREYVIVQAEQYHGPQGGLVDLDKLGAERPDRVVFNGYPDQYDHAPLQAKVGERVRIWALVAGPNRASSIHVIGGQYDTVWSEGSYLLGSADGPAKDTGAQALALQPAQGGFVELTFPEPGHYPLVSHVMVDAERGAHGIVEVTARS